MPDLTALYREDATEDEQIDCYQELINSGAAWNLEGHVGRAAMDLIENGLCILGEDDHRDYYGNHVPSRSQVEPGTKGTIEYARELQPERWTDVAMDRPEKVADAQA